MYLKWFKKYVNYSLNVLYSVNYDGLITSDLCHYSNECIVVKGAIDLGVVGNNDMTHKKVLNLKTMLHFGDAHQKSITHL